MTRARWYHGIIVSMAWCGIVSGATLFSDDFSNCGQTHLNWLAPVPSTTTTVTCGSGGYRIANTSPTYAGMMFHEFPAPKPAVFTASAKVTMESGQRSTGIWVCYNKENNSGYLFQLNPSTSQHLQFNKFLANAAVDTSFVVQNANVTAGANVLKVSKKNDSITLFCNDAYIATFIDRSPHTAGDLLLLVPTGSVANFDDVLVTDQWTPPPAPVRGFRDDFNGNSLSANWLDLSQSNQKQVAEGYAKIATTTTNASFCDMYVQVNGFGLDTFVTRAAFSHRSGAKNQMYGIFFRGAPIRDTIPMVYFSISGNRNYGAYSDVIPLDKVSLSVRGAAFETFFYTDTIEVVKKRNSPYRMYVNGHLLDSLAASRVPFAITGAGINIDNGMTVWVDFFQHSADTGYSPVIVTEKARPQIATSLAFTPFRSEYLFDPLGRVIRMQQSAVQSGMIVPGYYILPNGKSGLIVRKR